MDTLIEGVLLTPLNIIEGEKGNVLHGLRTDKAGFAGFGEVYFSTVNHQVIKGWKKHTVMVLNLVVIQGAIQFVLYDDRLNSTTYQQFNTFELSLNNYQRLTVPPGIFMAFKGMTETTNMLVNVASILHTPEEAENATLQDPKFQHYVW